MKFIANHETAYFTWSTCTHKRRESLADRVFALPLFFNLSVVVFRSLPLSLSLLLSLSHTLILCLLLASSFPPLSFKKVSTTIAFTRYLLIVTALLRPHKSAVYDRLSGHDGVRGIPPLDYCLR